MKVEYNSNNSGGSWWLSDDDWRKLEAAGWEVQWFATRDDPIMKRPYEDGRWLGALARAATREVSAPVEAIREFERVTGMDASDEGCNCCGSPHCFTWTDDSGEHHWASGSDIVSLLYGDEPSTLEEAKEMIRRLRE